MTLPIFRNLFQHGYVVRSLDGAMETLRTRCGVTHWKVRRLPETAPGRALAFAYVQDVMIELVDIRPGRGTIYDDWLPERDDGLRLNHLGYMVESAAEWDALIAQFDAAGLPPALVGEIPGTLQYHYIDTVGMLGHYCEFVRYTTPEGRAFWADVPRN